jgi:hypothetical protein
MGRFCQGLDLGLDKNAKTVLQFKASLISAGQLQDGVLRWFFKNLQPISVGV